MTAWTFDAIGTAWQIDTREPLPVDVQAAVLDHVEQFDRTWSRFRDDSLVAAMARAAGDWPAPERSDAMFDLYDELHDVTDGAVNPLVGRTLSDLGYDAGYSLTASESPAPVPVWPSLRRTASTLTTAEPVVLDIGAVGKGWLVDQVGEIVGRQGRRFTIDAGGDIYHDGTASIRVALEHPADPARAVGVAVLDPGDALCGSATNRRAWGEDLHHVLDARTGRPTTDVIATWAIVPRSCMRADGLATAHFFAEPDVLMERFPHEYVRMHADGRVRWSPNFPGEVFV
jgi:thiamine biosynthesis lipoprotein